MNQSINHFTLDSSAHTREMTDRTDRRGNSQQQEKKQTWQCTTNRA